MLILNISEIKNKNTGKNNVFFSAFLLYSQTRVSSGKNPL